MSADRRSRANTFAALPLDRAGERRDDAGFVADALAAPSTRFVLVDADGRALLRDGALALVDAAEAGDGLADLAPSLLGSDGARHYFARAVPADRMQALAARPGAGLIDLRGAGLRLPAFEAGLFAYARALTHWQARTRWCGRCGGALELRTAGHRAHCTNPDCALDHFPRTDPAVIVIVTCGDACLLGRHASWAEGRYSTLAGFVEPGETLEDAVRREVLEESGVRVVDCDYHSSQPWPFPASLMLGFTARADDPALAIGPELADARWFRADELVRAIGSGEVTISPPLSVSYRLIEHWLRDDAGIDLGQVVATAPR